MDIRPISATPKQAGNALERTGAPSAAAPAAGFMPVAPGGEDSLGVAPTEADATQVRDAVAHINQNLPASGQGIEFSIDDDSERVIVKVIDRETREVLRQMPTKEALEIANAMDRTQGLLIRQEA